MKDMTAFEQYLLAVEEYTDPEHKTERVALELIAFILKGIEDEMAGVRQELAGIRRALNAWKDDGK